MRRSWVFRAGIVLIAIASLGLTSGPSAGRPDVKLGSRWEVSATVGNGSQILSRISDSSTPGHRGNGNVDSSWHAKWRVRLKIIDRDVYIVRANAFEVGGTATGPGERTARSASTSA